MRVTTPIADMRVSIGALEVSGGALVMTNAATDAMRVRTVLVPSDVRRLFLMLLRPRVLLFAASCLLRSDAAANVDDAAAETHPTPNPW